MKVGLHDAELDYMKHKTFPNYALIKISAWHKRQGDTVELFTPIDPEEPEQMNFFDVEEEYPPKRKASAYDIVYSSKVFDFTPESPYLPKTVIRGGTGYSDIPLNQKLPHEIDAIFPDYSIYPNCDFAIGYLTRGCPNNCRWCVVPAKEGHIKQYREWQQIVRPDTKKLVLMDNNILACEHGISQLEGLIGTGYAIDLNQGMDARLLNDRIAGILSKLKWIRFIRFSCDQIAQIESIIRAVELLEKHGKKAYNLFIYLLVTDDIENAAFRVEQLKRLKGINIYAQPERNERKGIIPNAIQKEFAQRYVYGRCYKNESWVEYLERHKNVRRLQQCNTTNDAHDSSIKTR